MLPLLLLAVATRAVSAQDITEIGWGTTNASSSLADATLDLQARSDSAFEGFNVTRRLSSATVSPMSGHTVDWTLGVDYSTVAAADGSNNTSEVYSFSLGFEGENFEDDRYPLNSSDWQICANSFSFDFPSDLAGRAGEPGNASCVPYFGQACVEAWIKKFNTNGISNLGCRRPVSFQTVDECKDFDASISIGSTVISNSTNPDLVFHPDNGSYVDPQSGMVYSLDTIPHQGLSSGQTFGYVLYEPRQLDADAIAKNSTKLHLLALTMDPSEARVEELNGGYGYSPETRLLCGRASSLEDANVSGVAQLRPVWSWMLLSFLAYGMQDLI